jgi:hypothetical protein
LQIPLPPVDEKKKVVEDVDKDRRYAIDASIVRIMKSRKVMAHTQLVAECVEQLSRMFKVLTVHFSSLSLIARNLAYCGAFSTNVYMLVSLATVKRILYHFGISSYRGAPTSQVLLHV